MSVVIVVQTAGTESSLWK